MVEPGSRLVYKVYFWVNWRKLLLPTHKPQGKVVHKHFQTPD